LFVLSSRSSSVVLLPLRLVLLLLRFPFFRRPFFLLLPRIRLRNRHPYTIKTSSFPKVDAKKV
jgi:hypothetical protein